ncbi:CPBP family intramembrane metalloprotease [Leptobacterium flavescens]|uniref:CPBP family intramembrane metalloprotease n=1 Tax=Leptobacterium flavescens TaxID=472055 RepID=A0A6P0UQU9_9FLAO|nr:CPBP family intramembrane glutamic endopeptidase [Leptobacterium flavescens]NER15267.1 CPBP family intramembrane metalloprotease [Leptobacterium flavescens]
MSSENKQVSGDITKETNYKGFLLDLVIYLPIMFLIREVSIPNTSFIVTGLFWSFTTLAVASWRMKVRNISWKELGLRRPQNFKKTLLVAGLILVTTIICLLAFNIIKDQLPFFADQISEPEASTKPEGSKFGNLKGNWGLFFAIMPMVLIESCLEELLDRGFLINWFEKVFSKTSFATLIAVVLQAAIFGFRHSYDLSERSITVGIIGLIMGIAYVKSGRNLWPLIIAHCVLNTMSMIDRVV